MCKGFSPRSHGGIICFCTKIKEMALVGFLSGLENQPMDQRVMDLIPDQGHIP